MRKSRQLYFDNIVIFYAHYADSEGRARREDLRKKIIETGYKVGIENCGKRTKIAYWIFRKCPYLLKPMYLFMWPLVQKLKKFLKNVSKKIALTSQGASIFLLCKCLGGCYQKFHSPT